MSSEPDKYVRKSDELGKALLNQLLRRYDSVSAIMRVFNQLKSDQSSVYVPTTKFARQLKKMGVIMWTKEIGVIVQECLE